MTKDELIELAQVGMGIHSPNQPEYIVCEALIKALAQPEQEPVAILHRYPSKCRMTVEYTDEITEVREGSWPLYTTPPQSKPLTDEEIEDIWADCPADWDDKINVLTLARAIEAAHGIKGEA